MGRDLLLATSKYRIGEHCQFCTKPVCSHKIKLRAITEKAFHEKDKNRNHYLTDPNRKHRLCFLFKYACYVCFLSAEVSTFFFSGQIDSLRIYHPSAWQKLRQYLFKMKYH